MSDVLQGQIDIEQLHIHLGQGEQRFEALQAVSLNIKPGEFVCIIGPSGCGKSTLLGALAGHLQPSQGHLHVDGKAVTSPHPDRGLVFQHHTLFPWKKVVENVAFGLKMKGIPREQRLDESRKLLALVGLADFENSYPAALSGGMQQRVEIARVLINHPKVLLMDEPFGALDAQTRLMMQELLLEVWTRIRTTVVFITHDIDEALFLADRILVMSARPGRIIEELVLDFERPRRTDLVTTPAFMQLKRHCLHLLRHQHSDEAPIELERLTPLNAKNTRNIRFAV